MNNLLVVIILSESENEASLNRNPLDLSAITKQLMTTVQSGPRLLLSREAATEVRAKSD